MNNVEQAAGIIEALHREDQLEGDGVVGCFDATAAAQALADAGLLATDPQIIRTSEELQALDPDTLVAIPRDYGDCDRPRLAGWVRTFYPLGEPSPVFPAVVVATGAQVRAARTALQEATE